MKNKRLDSIMHFLVHNSFLFTVIIMGFVHAVLLVLMICSEVTPLYYFNILSVVVYIFCTILCKGGFLLPVYVSIFLEVSAYAVCSVHYVGWDCGSYLFLFSIVPIMIYFGSIVFKGSKRWAIAGILTVIFGIFVYLYVVYGDAEPVFKVPDTIRMILMVFTTFAMFFSVVFYNFVYIYSSEYEVTNLTRKNKELSVDAHVDVLTGLLNRRGFLPIVANLMKEKGANHFCIAFSDIDNFKRINDSFGHDCGDEVLRHISGIIEKEMHGCEICRWGGEEFIILMRDYDMTVAKQKMEYIRKCVETMPTVFYNKHIAATVTIGLEEYKEDYNEPVDIIKVADARMYYGKQHGKNILIFKDME